MGWASGSDIVEPVIDGLIRATENGGMLATDAEEVLFLLIDSCQNHGWDTEGETLGSYQDLEWVRAAFARAHIYLECGEETEAEGLQGRTIHLYCDLARGHTVDHRDSGYETEWPRATVRS